MREHGGRLFSVRVHYLRDIPLVEVAGEIDMGTLPELRATVEEAVGQMNGSMGPLVLDLSAVSFIECLGVGFLVEQRKRLLENGGELKLVLGQSRASTLLQLAELEDEFDTHADTGSAVADAAQQVRASSSQATSKAP